MKLDIELGEAVKEINKKNEKNEKKYDGSFVESKLLKETVFILKNKHHYTKFRKEYPDMPVYFQQEIDQINKWKDRPEIIEFLHKTKKDFGGWITDVMKIY